MFTKLLKAYTFENYKWPQYLTDSGSRFINDLRLVVNYDLHKLRCFNEIAFHQANRKLKLHKFHT